MQPQKIGNCLVAVIGYPVDPLGNKLSFGVNGDPARVVVDAFFDELTRRLVA